MKKIPPPPQLLKSSSWRLSTASIYDELEKTKDDTLINIDKALERAKDFAKIYELYKSFMSNPEQNPLRLRRNFKFLKLGDTDTDSYGLALSKYVAAATSKPLTTLGEYNQLMEILFEANRCKVIDGNETISNTKLNFAFPCFQNELNNKNTLDDVLKLFKEIKEQKSILSYERKNIWHTFGRTDTYKQAIYEIAAKACTLLETTPANRNNISDVYLLREELINCEPRLFNKDICQKLEHSLQQHINNYNNHSLGITPTVPTTTTTNHLL